jgi:hypothetical protein
MGNQMLQLIARDNLVELVEVDAGAVGLAGLFPIATIGSPRQKNVRSLERVPGRTEYRLGAQHRVHEGFGTLVCR